jgi:pyruvate kinase
MLSAESAIGAHPDKVVDTMSRICIAAERERETQISGHRMEMRFARIDEAIAMAALYTANHLSIKAVITLTESGATPLMMSRIKTSIPIYALSRHLDTLGKMTLYRDVYPMFFDFTKVPIERINASSVNVLKDQGLVEDEDLIILTKGDHIGMHGGTNSMKIIRVGEV